MTFKDSLDFLFKSIDCEVPNTFVFNKDGSIKVPSLPNHLLRYTDDANCLYKIKYYCDIITSIRGNGFLDNGLLKHHKNDYKNLLGAIYYKLSNKDLFDKHGYLNDKNFPYLNCPKDYNDMERIEFIILLHIVMIIDPKNSIIEEIESKKDCLKYFFNQGYPVLNNNFNETKVKLSKILFNYYNTKQTQTSHEKTLGSFIGDKINDSFLHKYFQTILNITEADLISKKDIILKKIIDAYKELNHSFEKSRTFLGFECVLTDLSNSIKVFYDKPNFNNLTLVIEEYLNREGLLKSHQNMIHDQSKLPEPVDNFVGLPLPPLPPNANKVNRTRVLPKTTDYGSSVSTIDNTLFNRETITSKNDRPYGKGLLKSHQNNNKVQNLRKATSDRNGIANANIGKSRRVLPEITDYGSSEFKIDSSVSTIDNTLFNRETITSKNDRRDGKGLLKSNEDTIHDQSKLPEPVDNFVGLPLPPLPPNANKVNRTRVLPKTTDYDSSVKINDDDLYNDETITSKNDRRDGKGLLKSNEDTIHDQSKLPEPVDNFVGLPLPPLPPNANKVNRTRVLPKTTDYGSSEFKIDSSVSTIDNTLFNRETITSKNDRPYGKGLLKSHQNMIQDRSNLSAREYNDVRYQLPQLPPNANIGESRRSFSETTDYAYSVNTNDDGLSNDGTSTSENALRNTPHNSSATHSKSVSSFDLDRFLKDHEECFNSEQFLKLNLKVVNSLNDKCDSELYTRFAKIVVDNNVNFRSLKFISKDDNFNNYFIEAFVSQNLDQDAYKRLLEYVCLSCSADKNALFEKIIDDIDDNNTFSEVILGSENIKTRFVNFLVESDIEDAKSDYLRISSNKKPRFDRYLKKTNTELYNLLQSEKVVSNKQDNQNLIHNDSVSDLDFVAGDRQNLNYIKEPEKISNESAVFATTASTVVVGSALAMASAAALFTAGASIITAVCVIAAIKKYNIDQEVKYDNLPDKSTHFSANESIRVK